MGFLYPNLISGTRGSYCFKDDRYQPQDDSQQWDLHNASQTQENFMWPSFHEGVPLKPDTDYTLYFWADRTDNMSSADIFVIDVDGGYVPLWGAPQFQIPAGGGVRLADLPIQLHAKREHKIPTALRQQRQHGWPGLNFAHSGRHAHGGHRAPRMGTSERGGVAVGE